MTKRNTDRSPTFNFGMLQHVKLLQDLRLRSAFASVSMEGAKSAV